MSDPHSRPDSPDVRSDDGYQSEFLSESSPDFEALRAAVAGGRGAKPQAAAQLPEGTGGRVVRPNTGGAVRVIKWTLLAVLAAVVVATPAYVVLWQVPSAQTPSRESSPPLATGQVIIETQPATAEVFIDGASRGSTPVRLTLAPGTYPVELRTPSTSRVISVVVEAGQTLRESVELAVAATTGVLEITSDRPGARVVIDDMGAGVTPFTLADAPVGEHRITVMAGGASATRTVVVQPGATTAVMISPTVPRASGGWITVQAPFEMQVLEGGQVIGTTSASRIMLPVGRHELELSAARFDFRTGIVVDVPPGGSVTVPVEVPSGRLSVNALPWADVFIDGQTVGTTPVANLAVPVGTHEIVFRHPQLGERRQTVVVTASVPARVGIDLNAR